MRCPGSPMSRERTLYSPHDVGPPVGIRVGSSVVTTMAGRPSLRLWKSSVVGNQGLSYDWESGRLRGRVVVRSSTGVYPLASFLLHSIRLGAWRPARGPPVV